jgi:predicted dehydrogenase
MNRFGEGRLRVVVSGSGFVTPYHIRGWQALANVEVSAIAARNSEAAAARAGEFGIAGTYPTLEEALDRVRPDVVDVCTPADAHLEEIRLAVSRGVNVLCQKPLATDWTTAREIATLLDDSGVRLMVHENFRFRPWYRVLGKLVREGAIGRPFYLRSDQRMAGTVTTASNPNTPWSLARQPFFASLDRFLILESMIHQVDVARYLLGEPKSIYARALHVSPHVRGEDIAVLHLAFNQAEAVLERSYASKGYSDPPVASETVSIEGEDGAAFVDRDGAIRLVLDGPTGRREERPEFDRTDAYARSYADTISHFVQRLRIGEAFETSLNDNLKTLAATLAAYRSLETGQVVALGDPMAQ